MNTITIPSVPLLDGGSIPLVGTGTLFAKGNELADGLAECIYDGYRLIDTAAQYANEVAVGEGIRRSSVPRDEIFVTTKVAGSDQGRGLTRHGLEDSLRRLNTDYVDLLLIHWPNPSRGLAVETWQEMLELHAEGLVKHVGVSNFLPHQLEELYQATGVWPVVDQIQLSPALARTEVRAFLAERGIVAEGWRPLGQADMRSIRSSSNDRRASRRGALTGGAALGRSARCRRYPRVPAQAALAGNADLFSFELTDQEMIDLATIDLARPSRGRQYSRGVVSVGPGADDLRTRIFRPRIVELLTGRGWSAVPGLLDCSMPPTTAAAPAEPVNSSADRSSDSSRLTSTRSSPMRIP